jgi:hypothetical protein
VEYSKYIGRARNFNEVFDFRGSFSRAGSAGAAGFSGFMQKRKKPWINPLCLDPRKVVRLL